MLPLSLIPDRMHAQVLDQGQAPPVPGDIHVSEPGSPVSRPSANVFHLGSASSDEVILCPAPGAWCWAATLLGCRIQAGADALFNLTEQRVVVIVWQP
jgi:hypothetical protein